MIRKALEQPWYFVLLFGLLGVFTVRDYGVPLDDFTQYVIGQENYHVLIGEQQVDKINPEIRFYGPVFETFCYAIDSMFYGEPEPIQKWGMRHAFVFLLFALSLGFFWKICRNVYKHAGTAWVLMLMLALCPRLFADAHYNSKDTVFLSLFIFAVYPMVLYFKSGKWKWLVLSGVLLGLATTLRLAGFFMVPAVVFVLLFLLKTNWKMAVLSSLIFVVTMIVGYFVFFPALWHQPIDAFANLVDRITHFPWPNDTLIAGQWVGPGHMPWWYFPVWYFVTVPLAYHLVFVASLLLWIFHRGKLHDSGMVTVMGLFLATTLGYVLVFRPNLYDSWRQLQFLLIPIILLSGRVVDSVAGFNWGRWILGIFVLYQCVVLMMAHPYQYVYFNEYQMIAGKKGQYDQDYWSLSTANGMRWIQQNDTNKVSFIYTENSNSSWLNSFLFPKTRKKEFISVSDRDAADYEIVPIRNRAKYYNNEDIVYSVLPYKDTICKVIRLNRKLYPKKSN